MRVDFAAQPVEQTTAITRYKEKTEDLQPVKTDEKPKEPLGDRENLQTLKNVLAEKDISLKFRRDDRTGQVIVELIDDKTGDAVRQMPSEVSLRLSEVFAKVQGRFIDQQV